MIKSSNGSIDFRGFTMCWRRTRKGPGRHLACKTRSARLSQTVQTIYALYRRQRHEPVAVQHKAPVSRIRGHFGYFGVNTNVWLLFCGALVIFDT